MSRKKTRIRDIASVVGVSPAAVSRALKGQPGLSDETRQRIIQVAQEQSYDFSRLKSEKIRRILFLLHRQHNSNASLSFYSPLLLNVEAICREHKIALSFLAIGPADPIAEQILAHNPDALICAGYFEPEMISAFQEKIQLPLVLLDLWLPGFSSVNPDNVKGACLATRHLIEQGYRRIAFLASSLAHYSIRQRATGYRKALYEAGILCPPEYEAIAQPLTDIELSLARAIHDLLDLKERPEAIFTFNDSAALLALRICQERGFSVPKDIAIVGFDNIEAARLSHPPLTTIHSDRALLARGAVELLLKPKEEFEQKLVDVQLIIRESSHAGKSKK